MSESNQKATILIVDDTPANIDILQGLLSDRYRVKAAINGAMALKIASIKPLPDLILLDIMMPGMDGYEVCSKLKSNPDTQQIPVIFVTAMNETQDELRGLEIGAVDYITKPISPPILMARVQTHLALHNKSMLLEHLVTERTESLHREIEIRTKAELDLQFRLDELEVLSELQKCESQSISLEEAELSITNCFQKIFNIEKSCFFYSNPDFNASSKQNHPELIASDLEGLPRSPTNEPDFKRERGCLLDIHYQHKKLSIYGTFLKTQPLLIQLDLIDLRMQPLEY